LHFINAVDKISDRTNNLSPEGDRFYYEPWFMGDRFTIICLYGGTDSERNRQ